MSYTKLMKGQTLLVNGDNWMIVDVAPAAALAEMVAVILEEEGFVTITKGPDSVTDLFSPMGTTSIGTTYVLVPEKDGQRALELIAETVTDYEGEDLEQLMASMQAEGFEDELGDT